MSVPDLANVLVVKIGGGAGLNLDLCADDLAQLARQRPIVVVHGVSERMNALCAERGIEVKTLVSPTGHASRYTDAPTRDVFVEAALSVNDDLRSALQQRGVDSVCISDAIHATRKDAVRAVVDGRVRIVRDDYTGTISHITSAGILEALERGLVPVIPPYATSPDGALNVDGDRASAALAAALHAETLVILSNVRGLYRDIQDASSFVAHISPSQLEVAMEWAQGRMKRKVLGAQEALEGGVRRVIIGDGRAEQPISAALAGHGTEFSA